MCIHLAWFYSSCYLASCRSTFPNLSPAEAASVIVGLEPGRPSAGWRAGHGIADSIAIGKSAWADLDVLCLTAMHKDPGRRFGSVEALMRDIDHYPEGRAAGRTTRRFPLSDRQVHQAQSTRSCRGRDYLFRFGGAHGRLYVETGASSKYRPGRGGAYTAHSAFHDQHLSRRRCDCRTCRRGEGGRPARPRRARRSDA
jgi:hypothetical protein